MPEFNVRADSVNVEQIMEQIRARIREKRGVDYTEEQIRALATVKLERFLDPRGVRSDLVEQFRRSKPVAPVLDLPKYSFEEDTMFETHRGILRWTRRLLQPILKLFVNFGPLIQALNIQARLNAKYIERLKQEADQDLVRWDVDQLQYEVLHNLVVEMTKTAIEVKNLKMRVESLTGRLEFNERRARALESAVVYLPQPSVEEPVAPEPAAPVQASTVPGTPRPAAPEGPGQRSRRRRRRRGRRGGQPATVVMGGQPGPDGGDDHEAGDAEAGDHDNGDHENGDHHNGDHDTGDQDAPSSAGGEARPAGGGAAPEATPPQNVPNPDQDKP